MIFPSLIDNVFYFLKLKGGNAPAPTVAPLTPEPSVGGVTPLTPEPSAEGVADSDRLSVQSGGSGKSTKSMGSTKSAKSRASTKSHSKSRASCSRSSRVIPKHKL